jgi:hypothetical protein
MKMLNAEESLFLLGASFCLNPTETYINLHITVPDGWDCALSVPFVQLISVQYLPFRVTVTLKGEMYSSSDVCASESGV